MQITTISNDNRITVAVSGRLDSNTSEDFGQQLDATIDAGQHKVIVDFSQLVYISSAGLRAILMAAKRLKVEDGMLVICGMERHITEVFEISGFLKILTVVDSLEGAEALMETSGVA